ncbi:MAG: hypothetical protein NXI31_11950 [bacterium]|nr:hypothetical protein [bacterium]
MSPALRAWSRLAVSALALALLATFACRPAWSPDGKRLAFHVVTPEKKMVPAIYDHTTGKTRLLATPEPLGELFALHWSPDGERILLIESSKGKKKLRVMALDPDAEAKPAVPPVIHEVAVKDDYTVLLVPPVVHDGRLFVSATDIARIDLVTGETALSKADGKRMLAVLQGDGRLLYLSVLREDAAPDFELGELDPDTLERRPLIKSPPNNRWALSPYLACSPTGDRIAVAAEHSDTRQQAILILRDNKIETVEPFPDDKQVGISSVAWARDGVTLLLGICRRDDEAQVDHFALLEHSFSGSFSRETPIVSAPRHKENEAPAFQLPLAISPDRKLLAGATTLIENIPPEQAGLYLVDLSGPRPVVKRVPLPELPK